jgi:hypothetical protein
VPASSLTTDPFGLGSAHQRAAPQSALAKTRQLLRPVRELVFGSVSAGGLGAYEKSGQGGRTDQAVFSSGLILPSSLI